MRDIALPIRAARICSWTAVWQLSERVHLAATGAPLHREAALTLLGLRPSHPLDRQSASVELDDVAWALPGLQSTNFVALSSSGTAHRAVVS